METAIKHTFFPAKSAARLYSTAYQMLCAAHRIIRAASSSLPFSPFSALTGRKNAQSAAAADTGQLSQISQQAERLFDHYGNSILRLAYSYLHNLSDAEEILQDTLLQYLRKAPSFQNPAHEKAWLLCVAGNLSKNRLEYNKIRSYDELKEDLIAEEKEDLSFVWEAVKELPVKYREAIHLYYYEGYTTAQIAGILKRKESTIRSDLRRGRERLKAILKEAYDFE